MPGSITHREGSSLKAPDLCFDSKRSGWWWLVGFFVRRSYVYAHKVAVILHVFNLSRAGIKPKAREREREKVDEKTPGNWKNKGGRERSIPESEQRVEKKCTISRVNDIFIALFFCF
jgi:hypothetical protein